MADTKVRTTQQSFADEVRRADKSPEPKPAYEFSNGTVKQQPAKGYQN